MPYHSLSEMDGISLGRISSQYGISSGLALAVLAETERFGYSTNFEETLHQLIKREGNPDQWLLFFTQSALVGSTLSAEIALAYIRNSFVQTGNLQVSDLERFLQSLSSSMRERIDWNSVVKIYNQTSCKN